MNQLFNHDKTAPVVYLLLLVLIVLRAGGAVSHYCFDGMEPAVSIHFDNLRGHVEHDDGEVHTDVEKQVLSENLITKYFNTDSLLVILSLFVLSLLALPKGLILYRYVSEQASSLKTFLPPLRAPPAIA